MKLLPKDKDKRNKLIATILGIVALLSLFVLFVIRPQYHYLATTAKNTADLQDKLQKMQDTIKRTGLTTDKLDDNAAKLAQAEKDMASGDIYAWTYDFIRHFKQGHNVNIPTVGQPIITECDLLPNFPYQQVKISVNGTAYYHDLGKFVSDLENTNPHMRVVNLVVESGTDADQDSQKLNFRADVVALIKPNS